MGKYEVWEFYVEMSGLSLSEREVEGKSAVSIMIASDNG